jgi:hypothetical protein
LAFRRGTFSSVKELAEKIDHYVQNSNRRAQRFVWTATADSIFAKSNDYANVFTGQHIGSACPITRPSGGWLVRTKKALALPHNIDVALHRPSHATKMGRTNRIASPEHILEKSNDHASFLRFLYRSKAEQVWQGLISQESNRIIFMGADFESDLRPGGYCVGESRNSAV